MRYTSPFEKFVLLTIALLAITATMYYTAPSWNPPKNDSGISKCKQMTKDIRSTDNKLGDISVKMTPEQYRKNRDAFANSRYPELQDAGVKFVESVRLMDQLNEEEMGEEGLALLLATERHFNAVRTACANHGVYVPQIIGTP